MPMFSSMQSRVLLSHDFPQSILDLLHCVFYLSARDIFKIEMRKKRHTKVE